MTEEEKAIENIEKELNKKYEPIPTYKYSLYENGSSNSPYVIPTKYFNERDIRTVLNLISNLQKENEELHKEINQRIKLKLENEKTADDLYNKIKILQKELDKKDEVINYIAKHTYIRTGENGVLDTITEEVIEHLYKKVEEEK